MTPDDLVERVAQAIRHWYNEDAPVTDRPSTVAARAAIAVALEEAATIIERRATIRHGYDAHFDAAALRAMIPKEG